MTLEEFWVRSKAELTGRVKGSSRGTEDSTINTRGRTTSHHRLLETSGGESGNRSNSYGNLPEEKIRGTTCSPRTSGEEKGHTCSPNGGGKERGTGSLLKKKDASPTVGRRRA